MKRSIAIVGCGAISQLFYLPAIAKILDMFSDVWLVDPNDRALAAATSIVRGKIVHSVSELPLDISHVVIAAPNKLHVPLAFAALERGADILIEKPFAIWPSEGVNLIQEAAKTGQIIAVNQTRRFLPYMHELNLRVKKGEFGPLQSIVHHEGYKLSWPFESGAAFNRTAKRTGVIMDSGVHVIDFYEYLFHPSWKVLSAIHDGFRGPEGLAEIELRANEAHISIRLSRYQKQVNVARLTFQDAEVIIDIDGLNTYAIRDKSGSVHHVTAPRRAESYSALADAVLADFLKSEIEKSPPLCPAASSIPVIEVLDKIYLQAQRYPDAVGAV